MTACEVRTPSHNKLRTDIKIVEAHAEFYVFASIGHAGEPYAVAQSKLQRTLDTAKARVTPTPRALVARTQARLRGGPTAKRMGSIAIHRPELHCGHARTIADRPPLNTPEKLPSIS